MQYRPEIDGLRAVAVIPVIFFHAGFSIFDGGFVGVDVFFVISGYLITSIIIAGLQEKRFSFLSFYERRARRIFPALFLVMAVCVPFALWLFDPVELLSFWKSFAAASLFTSNVFFWTDTGYFGGAAELKPLLHTWSLAVEEQYYFLFPLFMFFVWRLRLSIRIGLLITIFCISLVAAQWGATHKPTAAFYLLPTRGWELLAGAFVAFWLSAHALQSSNFFSFAGLSLILVSVFKFDSSYSFPGLYALFPVLGTAMIILWTDQANIVGRVLSCRLFVEIGAISFSLYLWHQPILAFFRNQFGYTLSFYNSATAVLLSFVLSWLSWKYVEQPFRCSTFLSPRSLAMFTGVVLFMFLSLSGLGILNHGATFWVSDKQHEMLQTAVPSDTRGECHTGGESYLKPAEACIYNSKPASWAVFGDSHAVELAYGFGEVFKKRGLGVAHFSYSGCRPAWQNEYEAPHCRSWTEEVVEFISSQNSIDHVVISYRLNMALFGSHLGVWPDLPNNVEADIRAARWQSLLDMIDVFRHAEKTVILVLQAPELPTDIQNLILRDYASADYIKGVSVDWWQRRSAFVLNELEDIPGDVFVFDPSELFCDDVDCFAVKGSRALYFDNNHMSVEGALRIALAVTQQVAATE
eukprot:NODE_121_length_2601_cov_58.040420_g117_i0.p1 GENE.NODE_121_length_2601_cov_58.040420_g117_i0~~NODE_121_length_2601_cov_58.040420_g117_i0.p1  ORF type:complete len:636 (+),score=1.48 NODE_121_length_2601_cov_58.040420_g117_i0:367-2274(+)